MACTRNMTLASTTRFGHVQPCTCVWNDGYCDGRQHTDDDAAISSENGVLYLHMHNLIGY